MKIKKKLQKRLARVKEYLQEQSFYLKDMASRSCSHLTNISKLLVLVGTVAVVGMFSASVHQDYILAKVGSNTVFIRSPEGAAIQGSATGFEIKLPSGKVYTLTNAHVCGLQKDGQVLVQEKRNSGRLIPRKVLEVYGKNDLCLVEGLEGYEGLELANSISIGQEGWAVGYPLGEGLNVSSGHVKEFTNVDVIDQETPVDKCVGNGKRVEKIQAFFMELDICVQTRFSAQTNVPTYPGNSGSPLVNFYGNVIGVMFASNSVTYWGSAVPLQDVKEFLKAY